MGRQIKPVPNLLMHEFGNEAVLLNLNNETYYALNGLAVRVWQLLSANPSIDNAYEQILSEYDVAPEVLRKDIDEFLESLQKANLAEITESA